jgi:hypothetical protein
MKPAFEILYVLALPDWAPHEVTPFGGFAPGLLNFFPLLPTIVALPPDILDPTIPLPDRLARRRTGGGDWAWSPVNLSTLIEKRKPTPEAPFMVVFSAEKQVAHTVSRWRGNLRIRPVHVSHFQGGGAISPREFDLNKLRHHLIAVVDRLSAMDKKLDLYEHRLALDAWKFEERRPSSLTLHSHAVTAPNEMVLIAAGEKAPEGEEGHLNVSAQGKYIQGITESANAVIGLCSQAEHSPLVSLLPARPDLILLAPSMYRGMAKVLERSFESPLIKTALRALDRQSGYTLAFTLPNEGTNEHLNTVGPILGLRGAELKLLAAAVGMKAAGTVAATLRLPPSVNRASGVIGQLARFMRVHDDHPPPPIKAARVFKAVQDALEKSIPKEHLDIIEQSKSGVKIVGDGPLEWIPIRGLPLGVRSDVSRINTTPGNLFLGQIRYQAPVVIPPEEFRNYLVVSMFEEGDHLADHLRVGVSHTMDAQGKPIIGQFAEATSAEQFIETVGAYNGPMLIVDCHGAHDEGDVAGALKIGGASVDVWSMAGEIKLPPIVVLSACDTHPFDRSHATVANGFLACGALAVLATVLPINAASAARFVMRLINRAVHYAGSMNAAGSAVPWTNIVGGVIRMELATDIIRGLELKGYYDDAARRELHLKTNFDLNPLRSDWYELLQERLCALSGLDRSQLHRELAGIIATSDSIRYVNVGNPELITLADHRFFARHSKRAL